MDSEYKDVDDFIELDEINCKKLTGKDLSFFITLTGIYGLNPEYNYKDYPKGCFTAFLIDDYKVRISIITDKVEYLRRTIFLTFPRIQNNYMKARKAGEGISLSLLANQAKNAQNEDYKELRINAYREDIGDKETYDGYSLWARYGFVMRYDSEKQFRLWLQTEEDPYIFSLTNKNISLQEFISHPEGRRIWIKKGWRWHGIFYLAKNSESQITLEREVELKALKNSKVL